MWADMLAGQYLLANLLAVAVGASVGATFADIDLAPPLPIAHRSAWTHGPLVPFVLMLATGLAPIIWWAAVGFLPAFALHLFKDMFPRRWHGGALIKLKPLPGALPALLSFLYLAASVVYSLKLFWGLIW